jgi:metacaspase-1
VVFFFSGHGAKGKVDDGDRNADQSIVVINGSGTGFDYIWDGNLKSWFADFPSARIVFIFDSCLSGGMSVLSGFNRIVNMACSANGLSYEGASWGGGHGQFTY